MAELSFCLLTTFYPPRHFGGDAVHAQRLAHALARRGHRVTVVHSEDAHRALGGRPARDALPEEPGIRVHALRTSFPLVSTLTTYLTGRPGFYARDLHTVFRNERFDVVHFHNVSLAGGPEVLSYGDAVKLYTASEHWLVCPMHVLFRDNREPCVEPRCLRCTLAFGRPPQLWRYTGLLERSLPNVDLFLSPSRFTLQAHRDRGFTRPMRVLPHFLPSDAFPADGGGTDPGTEWGQTRARPTFLFVGRLERIKGAHVLVEAFRSFRDADLLVAGDGEESEELRRQAAGLDNVRFLGRVSQGELARLYADATALLVPSVGYEVFGLVVLEAFAHGTPVVVNDLGALPELVEESGGGLVYRTQAELLDALGRLAADRELRDRLGEAGRVAIDRLWSEDTHLEAYFAAIEDARALRAQRSGKGTTGGTSPKSSGTRETA